MEDHEPEDLEREPDGIPHSVIGLTAFYAVLLAGAVVIAFTSQRAGVVVVAAIAIPFIVWKLAQKSERERDSLHPSR